MRIPFSKTSLIIFLINISLIIFLSSWLNTKLSQPRPAATVVILDEPLQLSDDLNILTFHADKPVKGLLIYVSNANDNEVIEQARKFAKLSYYVALIDANSLNQQLENKNSQCKNFSAFFKDVENQLNDHWQLDRQFPPLLIGQYLGSAEAYVALAQSKTHDYHAVISLNFEPKLINSQKLLCDLHTQNETQEVEAIPPIKQLASSWYLFQDKSVNESFDAFEYTKDIPNARLTRVKSDSDTVISLSTQILQWLDPRLTDQLHSSLNSGDLPLIEVPVPSDVKDYQESLMALIITGDGGWAEIDKNLAKHLSLKGIPTVALDSLNYFWKRRSPEETTHAVESTIKTYMHKWHKERVLLIGYSFGADLMPVIANKLTEQTQKKVSLIALLGLGKTAAFEFHLSSWLNADNDPNRIPLFPEIQKLNWIQPLCVYGLNDKLTQCPSYQDAGIKLVPLPGNHHFDKKYDLVVEKLLENIHE